MWDAALRKFVEKGAAAPSYDMEQMTFEAEEEKIPAMPPPEALVSSLCRCQLQGLPAVLRARLAAGVCTHTPSHDSRGGEEQCSPVRDRQRLCKALEQLAGLPTALSWAAGTAQYSPFTVPCLALPAARAAAVGCRVQEEKAEELVELHSQPGASTSAPAEPQQGAGTGAKAGAKQKAVNN